MGGQHPIRGGPAQNKTAEEDELEDPCPAAWEVGPGAQAFRLRLESIPVMVNLWQACQR